MELNQYQIAVDERRKANEAFLRALLPSTSNPFTKVVKPVVVKKREILVATPRPELPRAVRVKMLEEPVTPVTMPRLIHTWTAKEASAKYIERFPSLSVVGEFIETSEIDGQCLILVAARPDILDRYFANFSVGIRIQLVQWILDQKPKTPPRLEGTKQQRKRAPPPGTEGATYFK